MIKRVCDRCGEDATSYHRMDIIQGNSMFADNVGVYDLCDKCWIDFIKFLEQEPQLKQEEK